MSPVERLNNHTAVSEVETGYYEKVCLQERGGAAQRKFTGSNSNAVQSASAFMLQYGGFGVHLSSVCFSAQILLLIVLYMTLYVICIISILNIHLGMCTLVL